MQGIMNHPTAATLAAALAASLTLVAAHAGDDARAAVVPHPAQSATALAENAMDSASDGVITVAVNAALAGDEQLSVWRIEVRTVDGHVVLLGKAPDAGSRQRATLLAYGVQGVKSVDNRLSLPATG
jgi:hyperosmotically inducible protein